MTEEINLAGVFVPTFAVAGVVAVGVSVAVPQMLARFVSPNFKRFVWHPPLFDLALFVVFVGISYLVLGTLLP